MNYFLIVLLVILPAHLLGGSPTSDRWNIAHQQWGYYGDAGTVIRKIAMDYRVPVIVEIGDRGLPDVAIQPSEENALHLVEQVAQSDANFAFQLQDGIGIFSDKRIAMSPFSLLDVRLDTFKMPKTIAALRATLLYRLANKLQNESKVPGSVPPKDRLDLLELKTKSFRDVSGREVLLEAASQQPEFYFAIKYPVVPPQKPGIDWQLPPWLWEALPLNSPEK